MYHLSAKPVQRSKGDSTLAGAAYRAGEKLLDERTGRTHDYSHRRGVTYSEIMLPEGADPKLADRQYLWNAVEAMENRKDAQLAREINLSLPHELPEEQRKALLLGFVREQFVDKGMVADIAIHAPVKENGDHEKNHHAHLMLTLRKADKNGLCKTKTREWNSKQQMRDWRASWADHQNVYLERGGHKDRVDHRTLQQQKEAALERGDMMQALALDRKPEVYVGPSSKYIARREYYENRKRFRHQSFDERESGLDTLKRVQQKSAVRQSRAERNLQVIDFNRRQSEINHQQMEQFKMKLWAEQSRRMKQSGQSQSAGIFDGLIRSSAQELLFMLGAKNGDNAGYYEYLESKAKPTEKTSQPNEMSMKLDQLKRWRESANVTRHNPNLLDRLRTDALDGLVEQIAKDLLFMVGVRNMQNQRFFDFLESCINPTRHLERMKEIHRSQGRGLERQMPQN